MKFLLPLFFLLMSSLFAKNLENSIESFSPVGTAKNVQQVVVVFSDQMIPFGDPRAKTDLFDIDCPITGKSRWIDERTYTYEFPEKLEGGYVCKFSLKESIKTLKGKSIQGKKSFQFSTGGPNISNSNPYSGGYIEEDQAFLLELDAAVDMDTIENNVYFVVDGNSDRVKAKVLSERESKDVIVSIYGKDPKNHPKHYIFLQAGLRFPNKKKVQLVWSKEVQSKTGVKVGKTQTLNFQTREPFRVSFSCTREKPKSKCMPITAMNLYFSDPIPRSEAERIKLVSADGTEYPSNVKDQDASEFQGVSFLGPFPENSNFTIDVPADMKDSSGRSFGTTKNLPFQVSTGGFPPLAKFNSAFGIIESNSNNDILPVTLRNIEASVKSKNIVLASGEIESLKKFSGKKSKISPDKIQYWLRKVHKHEREKSIFVGESNINTLNIPKPNGKEAFEVVGIPLGGPGFYVVEIDSPILGKSLLNKNQSLYVPTIALVTNMSVHFKSGRENSIAWVTSLDKGHPVENAKITLRDCANKVLGNGITDKNGIAKLKSLKIDSAKNCSYDQYHSGVFVYAEKDGDLSFVHSSWDSGIENWRFELSDGGYNPNTPYLYHSVFDRSLLRAGETISMKHYFRKHSTKGIIHAKKQDLPSLLEIVHSGSEQTYKFDLSWDAKGTALTQWKIPNEAKLGNYRVVLKHKDSKEVEAWNVGSFNVEEFRVPLMKAVINPPTQKLVNPTNVPIDIAVQYLSGGGASGLNIKINNLLVEKGSESFEGFEDFQFNTREIKEGRQKNYYEEESTEINPVVEIRNNMITEQHTLDPSGMTRVNLKNLKSQSRPYNLITEVEFKDPNGEVQTVSSRTTIYSSEYNLGVKPDTWIASKDSLKMDFVLLNLNGEPVSGQKVEVELFQRKNFSHRKRLVGGFYAYDNYEEIKAIGSFCSGQTDSLGRFSCTKKSPLDGNIIVQAKVKDSKSNYSFASRDIWIANKSDWWFAQSNHDRMDLIPEQKHYEVGDTAKFQVRMPFQEANVLVTVEREGIIDSFVQKINSKNPIIELPIKSNYSPNVYVSALAIRGRISDPKPTALVDLGRPSYKLGMSSIKIGWKPHELKIKIQTDKKVYKIRGKVKAKIEVYRADGKALPENSEIAIAVVDEGLLELKPNLSWNLLNAMMHPRYLEVRTFTAQMQVVGRRHFGLKALPQGGGGGDAPTREMFDTLLYWNPKVKLDKNGMAEIEISLKDSLTEFRIVGIATSDSYLFGTGHTKIKTSQDLMIFSGVPPIAREGDLYYPEFTLRNTTEKSIKLQAVPKFTGISDSLEPIDIIIAPSESKSISWKVQIPNKINQIEYKLDVKSNGKTIDSVKVLQKIVESIPESVYQANIVQLSKQFKLDVERPSDALTDKGGIKLIYKNSLLEGQESISYYMERYPYTCLEQQVSKSIALRKEDAFKKIMEDLPMYLDADGLAKYFPSLNHGSPTLTSYILSISKEAGYEIPESSRNVMLKGLLGFINGTVHRNSSMQTADLTLRKLSAMEALSRYNWLKAENVQVLDLDFKLLPTSALIDLWNIYLRTQNLDESEKNLKEIEMQIKTRLNVQGTTLNFKTDTSDRLWWLMVSNDSNAIRLVHTVLDQNIWQKDMPKLMRGTIGRQKRGHWDLTTDNAWGVLAMEKFSRIYENETVDGNTTASYADNKKQSKWKDTKTEPVLFPWKDGINSVQVDHKGSGKPWLTIQSIASIPLKEAFSAGYTITKSVQPVEQKVSGKWSRGDILRVKLSIKADSDMTWVVLTDPIPTGGTILGSGLGRDSLSATSGEKKTGWVYPAYTERSFQHFREYYEYVPSGEWTIEYTVRLNQDGDFTLPPTKVEAMYSPEMNGFYPGGMFQIQK